MAARPSTAKNDPPGWGTRIATMAFSGLFMLAFGAGGVAGGIVPIGLTLWRAVEVTGWQPVSAQVLEAQIDESRSSKGGSTYAVRARYAYRVNGQDHEGRRIGLVEWGSDNVGDWHHEWLARLEDARRTEQPVAAWVDPARPERSILDRRVRWGLMAFHLPFAVLFTGVGVGAAVVFWRALTGRAVQLRKTPGPSAPRGRARKATASTASGGRVAGAAAAQGDLAPGVRGRLDDAAGLLVFRRIWPRITAGLMLFVLLVVLAVQPPLGIVARVVTAAVATLWIALGLHLAALRWTLRLRDGHVLLERGSWLHLRHWSVERAALAQVESELVYTSKTGNGPQVEHHRLVLKQGLGEALALTPALQVPENLTAVREHLRQVARSSPRPR